MYLWFFNLFDFYKLFFTAKVGIYVAIQIIETKTDVLIRLSRTAVRNLEETTNPKEVLNAYH